MRYNKVVCVGRNYAEHAAELNNPIPDTPLLFMKPATALVPFEEPIPVSHHNSSLHFELELAVLLGQPLKHADKASALDAIDGIGLALDLTLRDVQQQLKAQGHPWELAKAFDGSCPISQFVPADGLNLTDLEFTLERNGTLQQHGHTKHMLSPILDVLVYASQHFTLSPGDIVLTGTPAGVGPLHAGDTLTARLLPEHLVVQTRAI